MFGLRPARSPVVPTSPCLRISSIADVIVAEHSGRREGNAQKLRASFAVLQTFSNHSESQSLYLRDCGLLALAIGQDARRLQDLGQALAPAIQVNGYGTGEKITDALTDGNTVSPSSSV